MEARIEAAHQRRADNPALTPADPAYWPDPPEDGPRGTVIAAGIDAINEALSERDVERAQIQVGHLAHELQALIAEGRAHFEAVNA
jgi:hypothetical protein